LLTFAGMLATPNKETILFFDGNCNLCNGWVLFVVRYDRSKSILFSPLQSPLGQAILKSLEQSTTKLASVVLQHDGKFYTKSSAVLQLLALMGGLWRISAVFYLAPTVVRDFFYDIVARNRHRWFGTRQQCMVPSAELSARFV
jgi:predicted DCC family thiol-disulfide oxidoreductase YuxK